MAITKPTNVDSPYTNTNTTAPSTPKQLSTVVNTAIGVTNAATNAARVVASVAVADSPYVSNSSNSSVASSVAANAITAVEATTASTSIVSDASYYAQGIGALNGLIESGKIFKGANVYVTIEDQHFITNNVDTGNSEPGGSNTQIQFNNNGTFAGVSSLTWTDGNLVTTGIKTNNYYYANGAPFSGGGNADLGDWAFTANTMYNLNGGTIDNSDLSHGVTSGLTIPANGDSNALSLLNYYGSIAITAAASPGTTKTWTFGSTGNLTLPDGTSFQNFGPGSSEWHAGANGYVSLASNNGNVYMWVDNDGAYIATNWIPGAYQWTFDATGQTVPPVLAVTRGDTLNTTITGYTLNIGSGTQEAIITTPNATSVNAQRLVINPGKGQDGTGGEGGDIYLWAGRGGNVDGNGGDVKIRGGYGPGNGQGGYIRIEAGDVQDAGTAGYTYIAGGDASNAVGGYVEIRGGYGGSGYNGGPVTIQGGDGTGNGGDVGIYGGVSTQGVAYYGNVLIDSGSATWTFDNTGNLTLPSQGNIVGTTPNNAGRLQWLGNSSGDGAGYTTLQLVPDDTLTGTDQYLIIDPTAPGHIHIRAGGTQDNSSADLFLGGENTHFKVTAGANNEARILANSYAWVFGADSILTVPYEGTIRSIGDSVTLQSYNVGTGNVQSVYLSSGGGLGFFDQDIGTNWFQIFRSGAEPEMTVPFGYGSANLYINNSSSGNVLTWTFGADGTLTAPGNITGADVVTANTFVSNAFNVVTAGNLSITSQYGLGFTGTILEDNGTLELIANGGGGVVVGWDSTYGNGLGNIATVNFNEVGGEGILLRTGNRAATEYNWNFDNTGNLTLPGNTFSVNYANGTQVSLGGGSYGNADVSNFLANYGSNTIVTTGNITGNTAGFAIGYRDIPQVTFSANATAALADAGKHYYSTTAGNLALTLPDNANVALPTGATLTVVVNAAGNVLVNQGTGVTLYQAGSSTTGNRVVGAYGLASVMKVATNTWVISGTGVY